jgi:hypothetical protein
MKEIFQKKKLIKTYIKKNYNHKKYIFTPLFSKKKNCKISEINISYSIRFTRYNYKNFKKKKFLRKIFNRLSRLIITIKWNYQEIKIIYKSFFYLKFCKRYYTNLKIKILSEIKEHFFFIVFLFFSSIKNYIIFFSKISKKKKIMFNNKNGEYQKEKNLECTIKKIQKKID